MVSEFDLYVKLLVTLPEHPKVYALAETLRIPRTHAVGILGCLWIWCIDYADTGDLTAAKWHQVSRKLGWTGRRAETLLNALTNCDWMDVQGDGKYHVHNWDRYMCEVVWARHRKRAERDRKRQQIMGRSREAVSPVSQESRDMLGQSKGLSQKPCDVSQRSPPPKPNEVKRNENQHQGDIPSKSKVIGSAGERIGGTSFQSNGKAGTAETAGGGTKPDDDLDPPAVCRILEGIGMSGRQAKMLARLSGVARVRRALDEMRASKNKVKNAAGWMFAKLAGRE